ncbi:SDR family oxidoreductase, partial [Enterococcus casseliflavus]|uniref:SDR family oxidoreductase n=1 Tax=Enterococcus casseliflavus TaxID=37734 RepID=UPI0039A720F1
GQAEFIGMDITKPQEVQALIEKALSAFGQIDVLVNNAGLMSIAPLSELKVDEWDRMIDINIKGVLYGIAATLPVFQKQNFGHFINLASVAGIKVLNRTGFVGESIF